jgi:hypothetical protein
MGPEWSGVDIIFTPEHDRFAELRLGVNDWRKGLAERTGLEPATPGVTGRYSNRLNYRSFLLRKLLLVGADGIEPPTFAV